MFIRKIVTGGILAMLCAPFTAGDGCAAIVVGGVLGAFCASGGVARANTTASYPAVAKPWRDVNLSFSRPGRVARILAHRGQVVKAGQLLAEENDPQQKIAAQLAKLTAESTLRIQAARAELAQDQVALKRTQWAASRNAATVFEVQRAKLKVTIDKLSLQLAELKHQHDQLAWRAAKLAVQRRRMRAPFHGVIEDRFIDAGKSVNAFAKVLQLVQVDRLRIFVPAPLPTAMGLRIGQRALVAPAAGEASRGRVIWIAQVADSASNTLMVEIRLNNKNHVPAGQQVRVTFRQAAASMTNKHGSGSTVAEKLPAQAGERTQR